MSGSCAPLGKLWMFEVVVVPLLRWQIRCKSQIKDCLLYSNSFCVPWIETKFYISKGVWQRIDSNETLPLGIYDPTYYPSSTDFVVLFCINFIKYVYVIYLTNESK